MKRIVLGLAAFGLLCMLAYYSSLLYLNLTQKETKEVQPGAELETGPVAGWMARVLEPKQDSSSREEYTRTQRPQRTMEPEEVQETSSSPETILPEMEYQYYLMEDAGYVNIYMQDRETVFEYTDIAIEDLPGQLREEVHQGKGLQTEQELYDFLENYSS